MIRTNPSAHVALILAAAVTIGLADAACVTMGLHGARGAFQYVPPRLWLVAPLTWSAIAVLISLPLTLVARRWTGAVVATVLFACFLAQRLYGSPTSLLVVAAVVAMVAVPAGWRLARYWVSEPRPVSAVAMMAMLLVGAILMVIEPRSSPTSSRRSEADAPNVIVVFLDTVRYDAVFDRDGEVDRALPALSRLARESVVFDRAYAPSPWTLPSHLAAVTGVPVEKLGVDFDHQVYTGLDPTLAERFRRRGYRTAAVISNTFLSRGTGFERGFDTYEQAVNALDVCRTAPGAVADAKWPWFSATVCNWSGRDVTRRALARMDNATQPFFLVLNYMDAHDPYFVGGDCGTHDDYHLAIRCLDRSLEPIIEWKSSRRDTVLVIAGDHGEQFGEHGLVHHGNSLYVQLLHVPFMIRGPGIAAAHVGDAISIGMLPTILERGTTERPPLEPVTAMLIPTRLSRQPTEWSAIDASWHLIVRDHGRSELYQLTTDAEERSNLIDEPMRQRVEHLYSAIRSMQMQTVIPADSKTGFRSLGYLR